MMSKISSLKNKKKYKESNPIIKYNLPFVDSLQTKHPTTRRFLYQNTRSLSLRTNDYILEVLYNSMFEHNIEVGHLAETNTHWR